MNKIAAFSASVWVLCFSTTVLPGSSITTPSQNGVTITTTIDTANHTVTYDFDLTAPDFEYEQIAFSPSPLPALTSIELTPGSVTSSSLTEWNFHQMFDNEGNFIDWQLELQYQTGSPPPRLNSVVIHYDSGTALSGNFIRLPGDDNVTVTFRRPAGGFPPGQDDNIEIWAYVPEIVADTIPGDLDGDGFIGISDLNIVLSNWNQVTPPADPRADPSGDGFVGIDDLNYVLSLWNAGTPPVNTNNIPEPAGAAFVLVGSLALLRGRDERQDHADNRTRPY